MGMRIEDSLVLSLQPIVEAKLHEFSVLDVDSNHIIKPGKSLVATIAASHWGYVNNNIFFYRPETADSTMPTWTKPYRKPVMTYHPGVFDMSEPEVVGRIFKVRYCNGLAREFVDDDRIPNNVPHGYLEMTTKISDQAAMQKLVDKRYDTVSISAVAVNVRCSVCDKEVGAEDSECNHERGRRYDDKGERDSNGKLCYYKAGPLMGRHLAFVHTPGDKYSGVVGLGSEEIEDALLADSTREIAGTALWIVDTSKNLLVSLNDEEGNIYDRLNDTGRKTIIDVFNVSDEVVSTEKKESEGGDIMEKDNTSKSEAITDKKTEEEKPDEGKTQEVVMLDIMDIVAMTEEEIDKVIDNLTEDAKLSYASRKNLPDSAFCGPGRSFPAHDAAHVRAGLQMLNKSKGKDRGPILSCLKGRAKKYGIKVSTKTSDSGEGIVIDSITVIDVLLSDAVLDDILYLDIMIDYLRSLGLTVEVGDSSVVTLPTVEDKEKKEEPKEIPKESPKTEDTTTVVQDKDLLKAKDELKIANAQNVDLMDTLKGVKANRVADLKILLGKAPVGDRATMVAEMATKSDEFISDAIKELETELSKQGDASNSEQADSKQADTNRDNSAIKVVPKAKNKMRLLDQFLKKEITTDTKEVS